MMVLVISQHDHKGKDSKEKYNQRSLSRPICRELRGLGQKLHTRGPQMSYLEFQIPFMDDEEF